MKCQWIIRTISLFLMVLTMVSGASGGISHARARGIEPNQSDPSHLPLEYIWIQKNSSQDEFFCGEFQVTVGSTNEEQVSYVQFIYYGPEGEGPVEIGTDYSSPFQVSFNTCDRVPGWYQIYAIAYNSNDIRIFSLRMDLFIPFINYMPLLMGSR